MHDVGDVEIERERPPVDVDDALTVIVAVASTVGEVLALPVATEAVLVSETVAVTHNVADELGERAALDVGNDERELDVDAVAGAELEGESVDVGVDDAPAESVELNDGDAVKDGEPD